MNKNKYKKPIYAIREDSNDSNSNNSDNDGKEKQLWCICRSDDGARFMICCDSCEEWYHGDCVNITPKQSELISKYFCAQCQKRNPLLKIQYKPGFVKRPKDIQPPSKVDKAFKPKVEEKSFDPLKSEKPFKSKPDDKQLESMHKPFKVKPDEKLMEKPYKSKFDERINEPVQSKFERPPYKSKFEERLNEPVQNKYDKPYKPKFDERLNDSTSKYEKPNKIKPEEKVDLSSHSKIEKPYKLKQDESQFDQVSKDLSSNTKYDKQFKVKAEEKPPEPIIKFTQKPAKPGSCGECIGCLRKVDCNFCQNCRMKSDKGCLKRVCNLLQPNPDKIIKSEKLMLTKLPGEFIPTKAPVPKKPPVRTAPFNKVNVPSSPSSSSNENLPKSMKRPLSPSSSSNSSSIISSKQKSISTNFNKLPVKKSKIEPEIITQKSSKSKFAESSYSSDDNLDDDEIEDEDMDDESNDSDDDDEESSGSFVLRKTAKIPNKISQRPAKKKITHNNFNDRNEARSVSPCSKSKYSGNITQSRIADCIKQHKPVECHNIGCNQPSRIGSKYCSDDCGIKLAEQRLLKYLPSRIANWGNSVSISTQQDKRSQAEIQEECETIHHNLNILDKRHHDLIEFIDRWRSNCSAPLTTDEDDRRPAGVNDDSVQCVTCGYMIASTKALSHMENCYQKIEGGTMVFADFEEQPIGSKLFCDFYDNNIRGYCKRLAALCDHNKDPKVDPKTICAFPLSVNEKSGKVCMTAKIKCNRHVNWERIQRAVIDMSRYRLLVRYEELQVEDRKFKHNIAQRGGVMSLLLHETIDHQPMKPLLPLKNKDRNKKMRKFMKAVCI